MNRIDPETQMATTWPAAILFDLDGTLIDSVPDITAAVNELLHTESLPPLPVEQVRTFIGNGIRMLVKRSYAARNVHLEGAALDAKNDKMSGIYARHLVELTTLMPGVAEALAYCAARGTKLAVVTNKPQAATETLLAHFNLTDRFAIVVGDRDLPRKPEPDMLLHAMAAMGVTPAQTVMVGDSTADIQSARNARVASVAVRGGYTNVPLESLQPGIIIDTMADLPKALPALFAALS
ncbi:MAG TPA: phosphoglycolate phosphatase [Devosiaceae bacterium]|jgi:phosphoglycolate phosphatase